jgi:hypothetical protein
MPGKLEGLEAENVFRHPDFIASQPPRLSASRFPISLVRPYNSNGELVKEDNKTDS